uniref:Diacylglycerol kinase n=1 Tax=Macrostomum lignano TaxID=282301 RepID=A0A1I8FJN8_9PLAT
QVLDLSEVPPKVALGWCRLLPKGVTARLLVCGGDGTVGWVLSAIEELGLSPPPPLAIFPLGTGNDLSRVLGWGPGSSADDLDSVDALLSNLANASVDRLDRWLVSVKPSRSLLLSRSKRLTMSNYFSLGVDALVALNFDSARRSLPALTGSRMINKLWYFGYGTARPMERVCRYLHRRLTVILDGRPLNLPELEGLVVLNIASWGSGCRPWGSSASPTVSDDSSSAKMSSPASSAAQPGCSAAFPAAIARRRPIRIDGLHSSFHMAQLQLGLAPAIRLGQGSNLQIVLRSGSVPVQVDGEPWLQGPCTFTVAHRGQAAVLRCATDKSQG